MTHDRRLIEDSLPLELISIQSAREKSIRHGHISTLHIWWARRPLAAMRAAIFASLIPAPKDDEERDYLHKLIGDIVNWDSVKDGNNARVEEARALIRQHYPDSPPKVLDPFMGGGSTGLEALRLGTEAHGVELNPVAYLIQLCTLVYPQKYGQPKTVDATVGIPNQSEEPIVKGKSPKQRDLAMPTEEPNIIRNPLAEDVRKWGMWVLEEARKEIGHLYEDPEGRTIVGYLWARTAKCPNPQCEAEMPMARQWWLAKSANRNIAIRMVVDKATKKITFHIAENDHIDFDPDQGTMKRDSISCPVCGQTPHSDYLKEEGKAGRLGQVQTAVVQLGTGGKTYRQPVGYDKQKYELAEQTLHDLVDNSDDDINLVPDEPLPYLRSIFNVHVYGIQRWGALFNSRQSLALVVFARKVHQAYENICAATGDEEYAKAVTTYLAFVVDRIADYISSLCVWANTGEFIAHTFGRQALGMVWDYVELNPFSGSSGDWEGALEWVTRVIEHCSNASQANAKLEKGSATRLVHSDGYLDAVITDPPYYDAVPYADLSDFFYVWLKRSIGNLYPDIFSTPLTPKANEIVQLAERNVIYAHKDKRFYEDQLTIAFEEAHRTLKDTGIFVVVFAHKSTSAWETLLNSLLQSGLVVTASWPLHTERPGRLRANDAAALASSIFIVCRKREAEEDGFFDDVRREMGERIKERLDFFWNEGIRGADFFISAIGPAVEVFGRYKTVRRLSGEVISIATLLDLVQEAVADYTLSRVLNGRYKMGTVDAPTRFYVMYRWSYGSEKLLADDARRLAQALGAEISDLTRSGLLKQSGDSVTLQGPNDRKKQDHLGEAGRDQVVPSVIDVLHRAILVWQSGDRRVLGDYLAQNALGREDEINAVAQALINVLPQNHPERLLLENYLQGSTDLPSTPRTSRMLGME